MTVKELYEYAIEHNIEDYDIEVFHSDDGGYYYGTRNTSIYEIEVDESIKSICI